MDQELFRQIATNYLVPLFSGAQLEEQAIESSRRESLVAFLDPISIAFKASRADDYRLILTRRQSFAISSGAVIPELDVVQAFVDIVSSMADELQSPLKEDLLSTFQRRVVARAVGMGIRESSVLSGIDQLAKWGSRLYEGAPIAASIGFRNRPQEGDGIRLSDIAENDFGAVLGNGFDTLLEFDFEGQFITHRVLSFSGGLPSFCPVRQAAIAEWTTKHRQRIALTLNRLSEILVIRNQQLLFARRSGRWHFLTHEPVISQMAIPKDRNIRTAIYETCLDASFARTGACIGVVDNRSAKKWGKFVDDMDHVSNAVSVKSRAISRMIADRKFHELDRRLRQELSAIDGATVLSHKGDVLAVGAIIRIPGGSTGGGRLAAARALSRLGLGIKVSQDGGISGFRHGQDETVFRIM